jgi:hypothetical protein
MLTQSHVYVYMLAQAEQLLYIRLKRIDRIGGAIDTFL